MALSQSDCCPYVEIWSRRPSFRDGACELEDGRRQAEVGAWGRRLQPLSGTSLVTPGPQTSAPRTGGDSSPFGIGRPSPDRTFYRPLSPGGALSTAEGGSSAPPTGPGRVARGFRRGAGRAPRATQRPPSGHAAGPGLQRRPCCGGLSSGGSTGRCQGRCLSREAEVTFKSSTDPPAGWHGMV